MDSFILTIRNSISTKQDFTNLLISMEKSYISELVDEQWTIENIHEFWLNEFDGDLDHIGYQIYEYDEMLLDRKNALLC